MKKFFISLMLGFGAALGVFVALAMPPGGWGVAVGVGLGLLGCLPLLIIMMMLVGRGHTDRRNYAYKEAPQPVIIIQHPGGQALGYDPFTAQAPYLPPQIHPHPQGAYLPESDYYTYAGRPAERPRRTHQHQGYLRGYGQGHEQDYYSLPSSRGGSYPEPAPGGYYGNEYGSEYEEEYYEPEGAYYEALPPQPDRYVPYYGPREDDYYPERPARSRRNPARVPSRFEATEAEYRAIGEGD